MVFFFPFILFLTCSSPYLLLMSRPPTRGFDIPSTGLDDCPFRSVDLLRIDFVNEQRGHAIHGHSCVIQKCARQTLLSLSLFSAPSWKLLQCSPQSCFWHSRSSSRLCEGKGGRPCNAEETGLGDWENLEGSTGGGGVGGRTQTRADSAGDENPFDREHLQLIVTDSNSAIVIFGWFFFSFVFVFFGVLVGLNLHVPRLPKLPQLHFLVQPSPRGKLAYSESYYTIRRMKKKKSKSSHNFSL